MEQYVLQNEEMSTEVIADGIHLSDDLLRFAYEMIGAHRTCLVTDANRAMDAPAGKYRFGSQADGTWVFSDGNSVRGEDGSLAARCMAWTEWCARWPTRLDAICLRSFEWRR